MSEKVKLPKEVCDALNSITTYAQDSEIVHLVYTGACDTWETQLLSKVNSNTIMRALVLGYEPEMSPEEELKEFYLEDEFETYGENKKIFNDGFKFGVRKALRIHGINYDWLGHDA